MRFGIALALILGVIVTIYVAPAIRKFAHQLDGYVQARPDDLKFRAHSAED